MRHDRCEHGTIAGLCPDCWPELRNIVVPFRRPSTDQITETPMQRLRVPQIVAEALAASFTEGRHDVLKRAFEGFPPLSAAALAITILDYLPPDEKDNFSAFVRRIARE
jgi:hypothetical protein